MASLPPSCLLRSRAAWAHPDSTRCFLVPAGQCLRATPRASFSTSPVQRKKDNNSDRGVSAVRGTGLRPRQTLSVKEKDFANQKLPQPVKIEQKVTGTADHGLWGFFKDKKLLQTPVEEQQHGTATTYGGPLNG